MTEVHFEGEWPVSGRARQGLVSEIQPGQPFDPEAAQAASNRLMEACRTAYHPLARVRWSAGPDDEGAGLRVRFVVDAGPKGVLTEIEFSGNHSIPDAALIEELQTVPRSGRWARLTGRDVLLIETLAADQQALAERYQREGFMDVEIGVPDLAYIGEILDGGSASLRREGRGRDALRPAAGFRLTWPVVEGPRYVIGAVTVNGTANEFLARSYAGHPASPARIQAAGREVRARLDRQGHAFAEVELTPDWQPERARVDLDFRVNPGPVSVLREVRVAGNRRTDERILQREHVFQPGDRYSGDRMNRFAGRLERTGLFDQVTLRAVPVGHGEAFDLAVEVEEAHTGRVEAGVSWGEVEGPAFVTTVRERNFSFRPPFRGQALELDAGLTAGPKILRVETGLGTPRLADSFWTLSTRVFYEDNSFISNRYDQQSLGGTVLGLHPFGRRQTLGAGWAYSSFALKDIDPVLNESLSDADRKVEVSGPRAVWRYDATDQAFRPQRGARVRQDVLVGLSGLGGDTEIVEWNARGELYFKLWNEIVLRVHGQTRHVFPVGGTEEVPLTLRTFLGGADTLKGFEYRSVSAFDDDGEARGGEAMWWGGPEILIPAASRLDLAFYIHAGDVSDTSGSFSGDGPVAEWGIGFLIRAENFPVRLDVAFPLSVPEDDPVNNVGEARFSFSAAYRF
ncbi:MAG: BamA/TamA family outer membrane protein [Verrucomicrobia bacterium]|nr:BamA/TamA family outer membrane protein [Verrucomicrobiota bacterium]MCH8527982.1 BamA/TamA family outer membrane protein [Kiritimatiellia bacterium]